MRGDENEVHHVTLVDGSAVYVRVSLPGTASSLVRHEAWAMGRARDAGVPVPDVLDIRSIETGDDVRTAMVIRAANGRQLGQLLPELTPAQRSTAMGEVGRALGILNAIPTSGAWEPEGEGRWADPDAHRERYLANVLADTQHLPAAGLSASEVDRVVEVLESFPVEPALALCHGDVSPEHLFVDAELRVVGLIDFGQWYAGSAASELSGVGMLMAEPDFEAIVAGHPQGDVARAEIGWHTITQATGQIRWLVTSGQLQEVSRPVAALRAALAYSRSSPATPRANSGTRLAGRDGWPR
ncbi:phosphotransferase family protein [Tenggerimyces flavus]|uniref:Phosphotransferase family protein n=1 Tax=Tenggerimyces flavus TaxID=1708749 RepID=A0ABV7Y5R9_9ACTN